MSRFGIALLLLAAGILGTAYWVGTKLNLDEKPLASVEEAEEVVKSDPAPAAEVRSTLQGSADRRMDDFGSGPGGVTVTVPLRDRHRQAFTGSGQAGGGSSGESGSDVAAVTTGRHTQAFAESGPSGGGSTDEGGTDAATVPASRHDQAFASGSGAGGGDRSIVQQQGDDETELAALPTGDEDVEAEEEKPAYRVIERDPKANADEGDAQASDEAEPDGGETLPSFDVVRVDPSGRTVMAGRAAPLTEIEVRVGDEVIDRVTTTARGEWVSTPIDPLAAGDRELSLTALGDNDERVESSQIVVVSVPETAPDQPEEQPVAVIVDKDQGGQGRILQAPDRLESKDDGGRLALKLVDYDDQGALKLSGEAPAGVPVRVYIDNEPVALVIGDSKGYWITTLAQDLPGGDYTLRLDQLGLKGQTIARLETPFTRVTTPPVEGETKVDHVVVQPGNSLWRIARRLSGDGFNYVYIYEANQAQIRDPDVIYPGQVFEVPADVGTEIAG